MNARPIPKETLTVVVKSYAEKKRQLETTAFNCGTEYNKALTILNTYKRMIKRIMKAPLKN